MNTPDTIRVLILEDNAADADLMMDALRSGGFEPAWERVDTEADFTARLVPGLDLILSDYNLPQFTGLEALHCVRSLGSDMPFILVSGTIGEDIAVQAMQGGADDYLLKDRMARLGPAVRQALDRRRLRKSVEKSESAHRATEARFRVLVESGYDAVWMLKADGKVLYRSPAAVRILGYSIDELGQQKAFDVVHPQDVPLARRLFQALIDFPEERTHSVLRYRHKNGTWRWLEGTGINLLDRPEIEAIVVNYRDVTERRLQEQRIEKLSRVRAVTAAINSAIVRSREQQVLFDEACRIAVEHGKFGIAWIGTFDAQRMELTPVATAGLEAAHPLAREKIVIREDLPQRSSMLGVAIRERRPVCNNDLLADAAVAGKRQQEALRRGYRSAIALPLIVGGELFGSLSLFAAEPGFFDEEEVGLLSGLAGNISFAVEHMAQQARIERLSRTHEALAVSLRGANERLQQIYKAMPGAVMVFDREGAIKSANDAAVALFGYPEEEMAGQPLSLMFEPGQVPGAAEFSALVEGSAVFRAEKLCRNRSGDLIPVLYSATQLPGAGGGQQEFICVALDIREQKQLEVELHQAQKLESVGRLAAGIAHEINTPIQFVGDSVHFAKEAMSDLARLIEAYQGALLAIGAGAPAAEAAARMAQLEEELDLAYLRENVPRSLDRVLDGVGRVAAIVGAMKDFAHPDQKEMVPVDLNQAILNTLTIARSEYKYVAEVETELAELPPVTCHPGEVNQVILNVVVNAAHAIGEVVRDTDRKGLIRVRTRREGEDVLVSISDTGGGISEAIRERIFDPFFTTKEVGRGTGQGLAIARSVVREQHGGELSFDTEPGKGTTFLIRLPISGSIRRAEEACA